MEREEVERITQSIMQESTFPAAGDMEAQDDELFYRLNELVQENSLTVEEGQLCFDYWRKVYGR